MLLSQIYTNEACEGIFYATISKLHCNLSPPQARVSVQQDTNR